MQKIDREQLINAAIAGGSSKGNTASATASGDATASATVVSGSTVTPA